MYETVEVVLIFSLTLSCVQSHVMWEAPNELHPVHGLYVKPSMDGTTGDLYVAATEENGRKSEWLTDQPVNFLAPAATVLQPKTVPLSATKTTLQEDKTNTQKRAIITSPAMKYAYPHGIDKTAYPQPIPVAVEGNVGLYPYAVPTIAPSEASIPPCSPNMPSQMAQPYPFQYFYPQMMSAIASAMNACKGNEDGEEKTPIAAPTPYWPQAYGYPYQYVYVDPNTWAQTQTSATPLEAQSSSSSETA
ncbi:uncharacterized protein LOC123881222 [Maniola jurtina]|uniref:uncharacterized protein LOC123881222 n=1 Tax=Maniola jurtina TaxID=191418 RepID=UPI001E68E593|nr:uncharacterized protein LOC123881222 [Maniola jurtina]